MSDHARGSRWKKEAEFFDSVARRHSQEVEPIDPVTLARYSAASPRRRFNLEYRFRLLGNLQGREILDAGCGEGVNSILLAKLGARVTGVDISPASIEVAQKRAQVNGLEGTTRFICSPLETADLPSDSFDVVWGDAVLHHLIADLDALVVRFVTWTKPGGVVLLAEPVNLNHTLRWLRFKIPVKTHATPDERPLERQELSIIRQHLPQLYIRHFSLFGRLNRFILVAHNYERSSPLRRALSNVLALADYGLLSLPWVSSLAGTAVLYGRVKK
ncbi:MAG TPA: class I SAM-dependent methyltransferase [Terriglobia bacterium]|nr:class I SAM-dependent methyltransferase [Terriglobia bacterium]